jgi:hypothetical protein
MPDEHEEPLARGLCRTDLGLRITGGGGIRPSQPDADHNLHDDRDRNGPLPSGTVCGSFTYSPTGQVEVESVEANYSANQFGPPAVTFWVAFQDVGSSQVSFPAYALNASVVTNSSALREIFPPNPPPGITQLIPPLGIGQSYTLFSPYSGDNYYFLLVQPGTADVDLNVTTSAGTTVISAQFTFEAPTQNP